MEVGQGPNVGCSAKGKKNVLMAMAAKNIVFWGVTEHAASIFKVEEVLPSSSTTKMEVALSFEASVCIS
jgi:hypothetical protein